jgi:hypothetical protein
MSASKREALADHVQGFAAARGLRDWTAPMPPGEALEAVHIYAHPVGYFHYVTSGLSTSLGSIELTLRIPTESSPPAWPIDVLRRVASQFVQQRSVVSPGDTATYEPAILPGTAFAGLAFLRDDQLGTLVVEGEPITLLTCVPLTANEARACIRSSTYDVVARLAALDARLLASPRPELSGLDAASAVSSSDGHGVAGLRWVAAPDGSYDVFVDPSRQRAVFFEHLLARWDMGALFTVWGPERTLVFEPKQASTLEATDDRLWVTLGPEARAALTASLAGTGPLVCGPCRLHFVDEVAQPIATRSRGASEPDLGAMAPHEARRLADQAFRDKKYDRVLQLIPRAIEDGAHGLLAQLLHIDTLRAAGRRDEAQKVLFSVADQWLSGARPVWNTQWKRLLELARKLRVSPDDPRLAQIADNARR